MYLQINTFIDAFISKCVRDGLYLHTGARAYTHFYSPLIRLYTAAPGGAHVNIMCVSIMRGGVFEGARTHIKGLL